jgi:hypothetical protein
MIKAAMARTDEVFGTRRVLIAMGEVVAAGRPPLFVPADRFTGWGWIPWRLLVVRVAEQHVIRPTIATAGQVHVNRLHLRVRIERVGPQLAA